MPSLGKTNRTKRGFNQYGYGNQGPPNNYRPFDQNDYGNQGPLIIETHYEHHSYGNQGPPINGGDYNQDGYPIQGPPRANPAPLDPGRTWSHEPCYNKEQTQVQIVVQVGSNTELQAFNAIRHTYR